MADDYVIDAMHQTHETDSVGGLLDVMEVSFHLEPEEMTGVVRVPLQPGWEGAVPGAIVQRAAEMRAALAA